MRVLKVTLEGVTTSFRYPHFMMGVQPSFPMPPPATIYGHICSALGEWVEPREVAFAYHFTAQRSIEDMEHIHVLAAAGGKLEGTSYPKALEGAVNPIKRQVLFQPRLTLYLNHPEWADTFRSPTYPVVLGRSQDLCWYTKVEVVELLSSSTVYFEHTLLPYRMATQTQSGTVTLMPRWIDYERNRRPFFARYILLQRRLPSADLQFYGAEPSMYLADPDSPAFNGAKLGLVFHTFVGDDDEALSLAPPS